MLAWCFLALILWLAVLSVGKKSAALRKGIAWTALAWLLGLIADMSIPDLGGYLMLRVLLPLLVMGGCILEQNSRT